jgi:hypothetical protein
MSIQFGLRTGYDKFTRIAYPDILPDRLTRDYPSLTRPHYLGSTGVLTRALPEHLTRSRTPYPALPDWVTPYRLCPRSFTRTNNLSSLSLVDPSFSLSARFGLHLTRPTTHFYPYRPLTRLSFPGR